MCWAWREYGYGKEIGCGYRMGAVYIGCGYWYVKMGVVRGWVQCI